MLKIKQQFQRVLIKKVLSLSFMRRYHDNYRVDMTNILKQIYMATVQWYPPYLSIISIYHHVNPSCLSISIYLSIYHIYHVYLSYLSISIIYISISIHLPSFHLKSSIHISYPLIYLSYLSIYLSIISIIGKPREAVKECIDR